jgi:hypothetical protein
MALKPEHFNRLRKYARIVLGTRLSGRTLNKKLNKRCAFTHFTRIVMMVNVKMVKHLLRIIKKDKLPRAVSFSRHLGSKNSRKSPKTMGRDRKERFQGSRHFIPGTKE